MIVPQEEIKYIFNPYELLPGDILLMNTYEERLRRKMGCIYEHAAIYVGDAYLMESNGEYVTMSHIYSYAFREKEHACVLRMKKLSPIIASDIARNARKQMGREYVDTTLFRHLRNYKFSDTQDTSNRSFCSRLVAQSYFAEGISLLPNSDFCEPDDFLQSQLLQPVENAVVEFTDDFAQVVMNQQQYRERVETDSPNAELFSELSKLYGEDIQDIGQALHASFHRPELNDQAIDVIRVSRMFKHMEDVKRETPWILDDDEFLNHYPNTVEALHFLYSNMNHYDNTILQDYREFHMQMVVLAANSPQNTLVVFLREYIGKMVDYAIACRKRYAELYRLLEKTRPDDTADFVLKYGIYRFIDYVPTTLDIGFLLRDMMKGS